MKKFIFSIIALLGILMPNTAWAQTTAGDEGSKNDWHYTVNEDGTATIVCFKHWHKHGDQDTEAYCHCYSGDAVIPSTIDGYTVTAIGKECFSYCAITSVTIPSTVKLIDEAAFYQCAAITEITIPASVDSIASGPFIGSPIEKLAIDDSPNVLKLHTSVDFRGMNSLKTLYIGRNLNYPVTPSIGRTLFWGTVALESLTFGDYVTEIQEATFRLCPELKEVIFGPNMTYISDYAFSQCENLISADLPYGLTYIGKSAFSHCKALPSPRFPETLTLIDDGAYSQCEAITEITIPASVDSIASGPFSGCPIEKLTIDDSPNVLKLHTSVDFRGLNSLKTLYIGRNLNYTVTPSIGRTLFWGTAELESLTFGDHVTDIAEATFRLCPKLKEVTFSPNMTYISDYAFSECESLVSADLPYGLKSIGKSAFYKTSIDTLRLPQTVEDLGYSSFAFTQNLSTVYSDNPTPPACDGMVFDGNDNWKDKTVYVPAKSLDAYKEATCWKEFFNILPQGEAGYEQVATPTWTFQNEMLALSTETTDASIYYATANWENEAETDSIANTIDVSTRSTLYQDPLEITDNVIIKMIAAKEGMENSEVATFIYDYKSWKELYETVRAGEDLLSKAQDSGKVDEGLIEELKWALNEGDMMYQRRAEMSNQEAKYFTDAIVNICIKIKEQMGATSELKQDEEEFYLIGTAADWKAFAELALVNPKANARMTADIDLEDDQTMIGSVDDPSKYYQGIFDGEAHTLNVNYLAGSFVAPFRYVMGATIQRLHVTGRMEANETCCVGGIVASVKASEENLSTIIRSCWSSALLVATTSGSKQNTIGGIVAEDNGRVIIDDCLFDGKFGKDNTTYNGGFIANVWGTAVIRNGLNVGEYSTNTEYRSGTFYRPDEERDPVTLENAYYLNACGTAQGTQATEEELANGEILKKLQNSRTANVWKQGEAYPILTMIPYQAYMPEFSFRDDYIVISSKSEGAKIYYAIQEFDNNWSTDTIAHIATNLEVLVDSTEYEIPIEAREDLIIKAIAVKKGMKNSEEAVYIYPYTEWLKMVDTINELTARLNDAMTDYTPSPEVQSMIDRFKTQVAYIYDIYYYERTEWDRERVIDERDRLQALYYELEVKIKADQSEDIIATYGNRIMYVMGQTTMAHALEQVGGREEVTKDIAAIVWNSTEALTRSDLEGFNNPNMLIYVQTDSLAPEGVNNVIIDGKAKSITLVDAEGNNNFFAPQEFTVESISYTREFKQTTQKDISRGWEGISLPFTVQKFTHESHGEIAPFGNDASIFHFWLHLMTDKGLINATTIEACKPYIISMPNNGSYPEAYNQAGKVTFSAENTTVPASVYEQIWTADGSVSMMPTFYNVEADEYTYALNVGREIEGYVEGSVFVKNYRTIRPFEVYTFHEPSRNEGAGARFISVSSLFGGEGTTGIIEVIQPANNDNVKVYSLNGTLLKQGKRHEVMNTLPKGVYIINNKKMVVK